MRFGPVELVVVVLVIIILFGGKKLPELGRNLGQAIRELKQTIKGKNK